MIMNHVDFSAGWVFVTFGRGKSDYLLSSEICRLKSRVSGWFWVSPYSVSLTIFYLFEIF